MPELTPRMGQKHATAEIERDKWRQEKGTKGCRDESSKGSWKMGGRDRCREVGIKGQWSGGMEGCCERGIHCLSHVGRE